MRSTRLILASLSLMVVSTVAADDSVQTFDRVNDVVSGLRNIDANIQQIQNKGFGNWLTDQAGSYAQEHFPSLFGSAAGTVKDVQTAGTHFYDIGSRGMSVITEGMQAISTSQDETIQRSQQAASANDQLWDSFLPEQLQSMGTHLLKKVVPESVQHAYDAVADRVDVFCKNAEWLEDKIGAAIESGQVTREEVEAQIRNYIASGSTDGLERDGRDEQVIRQSGQPPQSDPIESAMIDRVAEAKDPSPAEESARASAPETTPESGVTAEDLQQADPQSSGGRNSPDTITPDELSALAGSNSESTAPNSSARPDTGTSPTAESAETDREAEANELNRQVAADEAAREAKAAAIRSAQIAEQAEGERRRTAAVQQQLAARVARSTATAAQSPQPMTATSAPSFILEFYVVAYDGLEPYDVVPLIGPNDQAIQSYAASIAESASMGNFSPVGRCAGDQYWASVAANQAEPGEQKSRWMYSSTCGAASRDAAIKSAIDGYIRRGGSLSKEPGVQYGNVYSGTRPGNVYSVDAGPRGGNGRAPTCNAQIVGSVLRVSEERPDIDGCSGERPLSELH